MQNGEDWGMTVEEWKAFSGDEDFDPEEEKIRKPNLTINFNADYKLC